MSKEIKFTIAVFNLIIASIAIVVAALTFTGVVTPDLQGIYGFVLLIWANQLINTAEKYIEGSK